MTGPASRIELIQIAPWLARALAGIWWNGSSRLQHGPKQDPATCSAGALAARRISPGTLRRGVRAGWRRGGAGRGALGGVFARGTVPCRPTASQHSIPSNRSPGCRQADRRRLIVAGGAAWRAAGATASRRPAPGPGPHVVSRCQLFRKWSQPDGRRDVRPPPSFLAPCGR